MYNQTFWQDHVTEFEDRYQERQNADGTVTHIPVEGEIIQEGTPQNQINFNNLENGVQDAAIAQQIMSWGNLHYQRRTGDTLEGLPVRMNLAERFAAKTARAGGLSVARTASGNVVSIDDGADGVPVKSLAVSIEPVQEGSGDPSPENMRPITGWTGVTVRRTGKNLFDSNLTAPMGIRRSVGVWTTNTWYAYDDTEGYFRTTCNYTANGGFALNRLVKVRGGETITVSADVCLTGTHANTQARVLIYDAGDASAAVIYSRAINIEARGEWKHISASAEIPPGCKSVYVGIIPNYGGLYVKNIQAEPGDADTGFEAFGETRFISLDAAGTVYGGTLDVTNGVLTVTQGSIDSYAGEELPGAWISSMEVYSEGAAPTAGAQVVYELAEPVTYRLTPTEVATLLGVNHIWADTGDVNVTYRADPVLVYDKLKDLAEGTDFDVESAAVTAETHTITLTNTEKYPFNSTMDNPVAVALTTSRRNLYYTVEAEVTEHTGDVGEIHITDKALNGFKVSFDGGGTSVTLTLKIEGGTT